MLTSDGLYPANKSKAEVTRFTIVWGVNEVIVQSILIYLYPKSPPVIAC